MYKMNQRYQLEFDETTQMNTIVFDKTTGIPLETMLDDDKYTPQDNQRVQQHILMKIINEKLKKEYNQEISFATRKKSKNRKLSSLHITKYPVFDENGTFQMKDMKEQNNSDEYDLIWECVAKTLEGYLNKTHGTTNALVIGDSIEEIVKTNEIENYHHLTRSEFLSEISTRLVESIERKNQLEQMKIEYQMNEENNNYNNIIQLNQQINDISGNQIPMQSVLLQIPLLNGTVKITVSVTDENGNFLYNDSKTIKTEITSDQVINHLVMNETSTPGHYDSDKSNEMDGFKNYTE